MPSSPRHITKNGLASRLRTPSMTPRIELSLVSPRSAHLLMHTGENWTTLSGAPTWPWAQLRCSALASTNWDRHLLELSLSLGDVLTAHQAKTVMVLTEVRFKSSKQHDLARVASGLYSSIPHRKGEITLLTYAPLPRGSVLPSF